MSAAFKRMALGVLLASAGGAVCACPEKLPAGMNAVTVGESVVVNGIGMSILQVESREKVGALFARIEKEWTDAGYAVKRNQAEGWNVLSALSDKCMTTLQLVDRPAAFGYMAVNRLAKPFATGLPAAPVPGGAKVLSTVLSDDDGRKGSTTMLSSTQSVEQLSEFYQRRLSEDKWSGVHAMGTMGTDNRYKGMSVSAQRGRERIEVVIVRDEGSKVVVNVATEL
jgi:hypothetical protein